MLSLEIGNLVLEADSRGRSFGCGFAREIEERVPKDTDSVKSLPHYLPSMVFLVSQSTHKRVVRVVADSNIAILVVRSCEL